MLFPECLGLFGELRRVGDYLVDWRCGKGEGDSVCVTGLGGACLPFLCFYNPFSFDECLGCGVEG